MLLIMITVQYFANFISNVAVTMSDISNFLIDFKELFN